MGGNNIGFPGRGKAGQRASGKGYQDEAKARINMAHKNNGYQDEDGGTRMGGTRMGQAPSLHLFFDAGPQVKPFFEAVWGHQDGASPIPTFIL